RAATRRSRCSERDGPRAPRAAPRVAARGAEPGAHARLCQAPRVASHHRPPLRRGPAAARLLNAIEVRDIAKRYGDVRALAGVSLTVRQGEFFGLLGPNGAGKTTLISALGGLVRADTGTLRVMGHDVGGDYRLARRAVGIVPQEIVFDPFFTVRETLEIQSGYL